MARQPRAKKTEQFGKGKVTPVQIAYIVDQYLSENHFTQTRTLFRSEASALISKTPLQEGPKGLMSLGMIIGEYVSMKEEKLVVEMEKKKLEQERFRVQSLLQGMQNVMNTYNASSIPVAMSASSLPTLPPSVQQSDLNNASSAGQMVNVSPNVAAPMVAPISSRGPTSLTSSSKKRQASSMATYVPTKAKKSCNGNKQQFAMQSSTDRCVDNSLQVQESNVAKLMIHQTTSTTTAMQNSSGSVTPPQAALSAQSEKNASPVGHSSSTNSSNRNTPPDFASNCTIVSTKTVIVSPYKQATYYSVEKHCSTTCSPAKSDFQRSIKRDGVKGRLNFDGPDETTSFEKSKANESSTSESDDMNFFDLDLPVLDFDIADLLTDFGIYHEDFDASPSPAKCLSSIRENTST